MTLVDITKDKCVLNTEYLKNTILVINPLGIELHILAVSKIEEDTWEYEFEPTLADVFLRDIHKCGSYGVKNIEKPLTTFIHTGNLLNNMDDYISPWNFVNEYINLVRHVSDYSKTTFHNYLISFLANSDKPYNREVLQLMLLDYLFVMTNNH